MTASIILASASPRRQELLRSIGLPFEVFAADVDEDEKGAPEEVVLKLARRKAEAAAIVHPHRTILAADTLVYAQGETLGKPLDAQDARRMLKLLSGRQHTVYSGVCLLDRHAGKAYLHTEATKVCFVPLSDDEIERYIASGEPFGKAGAYAVQGMAGMYVSRIEGSYSNVVGLPLHAVMDMLRQASQISD